MHRALSVFLVALAAIVASVLVDMATGPRKPIVIRVELEPEPQTLVEALEQYSEASARLIELVERKGEMGCSLNELVPLIEAAQNATERAWAAVHQRVRNESALSQAEDDH